MLKLKDLNLNKEQIDLIIKIVDLQVYGVIDMLEDIEIEDYAVYAIYRLHTFASIKRKLQKYQNNDLEESKRDIIFFDGDECLELSENIIDGIEEYNASKEEKSFLINLKKVLFDAGIKRGKETMPQDGTTLIEYLDILPIGEYDLEEYEDEEDDDEILVVV